MPVYEIRCPIPPKTVDAAETLLLEFEDTRWSVAEDVLAGTAAIVGLFESEAEAREQWARLAPYVRVCGEPEVRELADTDWRESYKLHFKPWSIGRLHWVPLWERESYALPAGHEVVWLDPGMAFGTGNHETTRLCVERLVALAEAGEAAGRSLIDAGCGSGILAISAARLGFGPVAAFDNDPDAVRIAGENAALNEVADRISLHEGDLQTGFLGRRWDVVVANILANVLVAHADELVAAVRPGGLLVLSGILAGEAEAVRARFREAAPGWAVDSRTMGEWADVALRRPQAG